MCGSALACRSYVIQVDFPFGPDCPGRHRQVSWESEQVMPVHSGGHNHRFVTSECLSQDANANSSRQVRFPTYTAGITQDEDPDSYSRFSIYGVFNEDEASSSQWPAHCTCVYLDVLYEH